MVTIDIAAGGTTESRWLPWLAMASWPALDPATCRPGRPLIVAPHPDDEILGAGGLLALAGGEIVAVTDGEASHEAYPGGPAALAATTLAMR